MHNRFQAPPETSLAEHDGRQLLTRHRTGDAEAFAKLIELYRSQVYSYLCRCGVTAERDDLFQEIFVKIHLNAAQYQDSQPLRPWLFTVMANTVRSHFRKEKRRRIIAVLTFQKEKITGCLQQHIEGKETAAWLESAVQRLPFAQREALALVAVQNISQEEAAQALGVPLSTLKTNLRRAKLTLAKALARKKSTEHREVES